MIVVSCYERLNSVCIPGEIMSFGVSPVNYSDSDLSLNALTKISDVMESKPILKGTRLQSICQCVENHFAVQSICDRVLNFDLQPHYQKQTHGTDVMD